MFTKIYNEKQALERFKTGLSIEADDTYEFWLEDTSKPKTCRIIGQKGVSGLCLVEFEDFEAWWTRYQFALRLGFYEDGVEPIFNTQIIHERLARGDNVWVDDWGIKLRTDGIIAAYHRTNGGYLKFLNLATLLDHFKEKEFWYFNDHQPRKDISDYINIDPKRRERIEKLKALHKIDKKKSRKKRTALDLAKCRYLRK